LLRFSFFGSLPIIELNVYTSIRDAYHRPKEV